MTAAINEFRLRFFNKFLLIFNIHLLLHIFKIHLVSNIDLQSVAKVLGHSPGEIGFLTEFEKLPPPPQNNVANSEHTYPCLFQH